MGEAMENYVNSYTAPPTSSPKDEPNESTLADQAPPASGDSTKMALTGDDSGKVKFTNAANHHPQPASPPPPTAARNGEAKVEIEGLQVAFAGMGKEELMRFAHDPFWIRLRWALLVLFWLVWLAMLVGAVVIVVFAKRCDPLPTLDWWQRNVAYEIDPATFSDSDGDGVGDLNGIKSRLDYLNELGAKTIVLGPFYASDAAGNGHDAIVNHTAVDQRYGSMEDFTNLVEALNEKDMKLVVAFVPGQTSKASEWFAKSRHGADDYANYYIWMENIGNKVNDTGKLGWTFDDVRKENYVHDAHDRPVLNLRSRPVQDELTGILKFWLDHGVSGFKISDLHVLEEEENAEKSAIKKENSSFVYDMYQSHSSNLLHSWRDLLTGYEAEHGGGHRLLILDTEEEVDTPARHANETQLVDITVNTAFQQALRDDPTGEGITRSITEYMDTLPSRTWPNWKIGVNENLDLEPGQIDGLHMITMLLIGTPITTSGEELGITSWSKKDEQPVVLNGTETSSESSVQAAIREQSEKSHSHYTVFKRLAKLRHQESIKFGSLGILNVSSQLVAFSRIKKGTPAFVVVVNFRNTSATVDLRSIESVSTKYGASTSSNVGFKFPEDGTLELTSCNVPPNSKLYNIDSKVKVKFHGVSVGPYEAIVVNFVPNYN